uniref:Reverse transcriptase Ty1/copia-type domain-containing protein n=1 Tax=Amphimedon queenslandica TaxID=400682 RepID=A0A1X7TNA5_AMPQE
MAVLVFLTLNGLDLDDLKLISGYLFQAGGTAVSWRSRKQSCVALSTPEGEYIALSQAAIWLRQLNIDLQPLKKQSEATTLFEDNQAATCLARNPQFHGRSKHIDIRHHFIREHINN